MTAPTLREAAQAALDALTYRGDYRNADRHTKKQSAIDALRSALAAQPAPDAGLVAQMRIALTVAQGALGQCQPCAHEECRQTQQEWITDAYALCERALATSSNAAPIAQQAALEVTTGEVPAPMSEADQARLHVALGSVFGWRKPIAQQAAPQCACKDRPADQCPGEWEPGCDLGANAAHVRVAQQAAPAQARQPLTSGAIARCMVEVSDPLLWGRMGAKCGTVAEQFARAIEAAHGITVAQKGE